MVKSYGWAGTVLNVDLTSGQIIREPLPPDFARKYLGALGFNAARLFELVKPDADPLGPENVLMFGAGPLSGTLFPGCSRLAVTAKSPLTDIYGTANMGGFFASELKNAGYDQIIFSGRSEKPVYLWIDDDRVEIRDASRLWGQSTWDTARLIKEEVGDPDIQVVCIGLAGENLVRIANVMSPQKRAAGRCGMGAVMGSKKLKAVAVRGRKGVDIARPDDFLQACRDTRENLETVNPNYKWLHDFGTPFLVDRHAPNGGVCVKNYTENIFPAWPAVSGSTLKKDFTTSMRACSACNIACGLHTRVRSGEFEGVEGDGPEFAVTGAGLRMAIDNLPGLLKIHELLNLYGIDVLGVRGILGWAMDCHRHGILTEADFGGRPLAWGDYQAVIEMIPKIARREGFGNIIAEGEKRAPKLVGRGSEKYMHHVKGASLPSEDPRADLLFGAQYLTAPRGCDHLTAAAIHMIYLTGGTQVRQKIDQYPQAMNRRVPDHKGMVIKWCEDICAIVTSLGLCIRTGGGLPFIARALSAATGCDFTVDELLKTGERIFNLQKAFNSRLGLTRQDDNFSVPEKFTKDPIKEGIHKGEVFQVDAILDNYYETRGWDKASGLQTRQKLSELGLEHITTELEKAAAIK